MDMIPVLVETGFKYVLVAFMSIRSRLVIVVFKPHIASYEGVEIIDFVISAMRSRAVAHMAADDPQNKRMRSATAPTWTARTADGSGRCTRHLDSDLDSGDISSHLTWSRRRFGCDLQ